jgi:Glyoxalase superfamily protein
MGETFEAIPILRIFDQAKARELDLDLLGFELDWAHRCAGGAPLQMQVTGPFNNRLRLDEARAPPDDAG